jgi:subtilisin family serine protease
MIRLFLLSLALWSAPSVAATIAIIDTGFDLDHDFLRPKIFKSETDEEAVDPKLVQKFHGWKFNDNSHLKKSVIDGEEALQEVLLYRNLKAKGHREGLSPEEFEWFSKKNTDKDFMQKVKKFKKHAHGTFVAGIALREGENINIFPIRGLHIPVPVVAVEGGGGDLQGRSQAKTPQEKFNEDINNSLDRISKKFSKICHYLSLRRIEVVNASYGITYKNIVTKFRETYKKHTGLEIDEPRLHSFIDMYFNELYARGEKTMRKYPNLLFVFSAGNSGLDNDRYHHYPSRIKLTNTISVAAVNGEHLATFSNYGKVHVDIGAPGVAILSLVPKVYSRDGTEMYSPSSGTSMAAPYISNLAAQIMNANPRLKVPDVKRLILETGSEKIQLKEKLISSAIADNQRAIKAALLSRDMSLSEAINLSKLDLVPMEDKISFPMSPPVSPAQFQKKILDSVPKVITPAEVDEDPTIEEEASQLTKQSSFLRKDPKKAPQDSLTSPSSAAPEVRPTPADPAPSNQSEGQSPPPSEESPASSSPDKPSPPQDPPSDPTPELPQS